MAVTWDNPLPEGRFLFGASFPPYALGEDWPMEEWEEDLRRMKALHFNTVRVFAGWSRIEPEEDQYDFSRLDFLFSLARKLDMQVILHFGGLFTDLCGRGRPWYLRDLEPYCRDNPYLRERAFRYMERVVERYASSPQLIAWMIWNEPSSGQCACPHTMARFREWLREKYGTIDALNRAWSGGEPVRFGSFEEVDGLRGQGIAARMDLGRFHQRRLAQDLAEITQLVRRLDPCRRPATANLVYHLAASEGPVNILEHGLSLSQAGEAMTLMGVSCYTAEHYYDPLPAYTVSYKLSRLRCASRDRFRRTLVLETGAGPNLRQLTGRERTALLWQLIAHNAKGLLLWNWRSRVDGGQVGLFHLMAFDGSPTRRAEEMGRLSALLQRHARLLNRVCPRCRAAVLTLEDTQLLQAVNYSESVHAPVPFSRVQLSRFGAYRLLYDRQLAADCLCESCLDQLERYPLLLLPAQEQMTPGLARRLRAYVAGGGVLLAEGPFAFRDGEGRLQYRFPAFGLEEVFGCWSNDRQRAGGLSLRLEEGGEVQAGDFFCSYTLTTGEALARWEDGSAAAVANRYGRGTALALGTECFRLYASSGPAVPAGLNALLERCLAYAGLEPDLRLEGLPPCSDVEAVRLASEEGDSAVYILINHSGERRSFRILPREPRVVDLETGGQHQGPFEAALEPRQVLALAWEKQAAGSRADIPAPLGER